MDSLVGVEVGLLPLPMLHVIFPESIEEQGILLVHEETLAISFVRFHCTNVSSTFLGIFHSSETIVLSIFEFSDILRGLSCHLSKTLGQHIVKLTSIDRNTISVEVSTLTCRFTVNPHPIVDFIAFYKLLPAWAMRQIIVEHSCVYFFIAISNFAESFSLVSNELTFVLLINFIELLSIIVTIVCGCSYIKESIVGIRTLMSFTGLKWLFRTMFNLDKIFLEKRLLFICNLAGNRFIFRLKVQFL